MFIANLFGLGNPVELAIIGVVAVILFGSTKIGQLGKSMGEGLKEFKKATRDEVEPTVVAPPPKIDQDASPVDTPHEESKNTADDETPATKE